MSELINQKSKPVPKNYEFIDTIRSIAMIFIVVEHSIYFDDFVPTRYSLTYWTYLSGIQLAKFGTIAFFILAGFLIGDKFQTYTAAQYFKRRFSNTFLPWIIWSSVFIGLLMFNQVVFSHVAGFNFWTVLLEKSRMTFFFTNYWFIINFIICILIILIFKRYLYSYKFGVVLFVLSLFYSVNIYFEWINPGHTIAIFGFVFYLWLGAQFNKYWEFISKLIESTSYLVLVIAVIATYILAVFEISYLKDINSADPYNTLRFSNILYSISMFLFLLKLRNFKYILYLKPRETTYGIYLIHYIILIFVLREIVRPMHIDPINLSVFTLVLYQILRFLFVYGLTFGIVSLINRTRLKAIVGR